MFLAVNQPYARSFVATSAAGVQIDTGNNLIDTEFGRNRQLLQTILTPGKGFRGENNDSTGLSFLAKPAIWHGRSNFNMLVDDFNEDTYLVQR